MAEVASATQGASGKLSIIRASPGAHSLAIPMAINGASPGAHNLAISLAIPKTFALA